METIDITPLETEEISIEEFLRRKEDGTLRGVRIDGIVPFKLGKKSGSFGSIRIKRDTPLYRPL